MSIQGNLHSSVPDHKDVSMESLVTLLLHNTKSFTVLVANELSKHNFTVDEWMVLVAISQNNGSPMTEISAASGCYGATLTRAVDKLVSGALVYREASAVDRRKVVGFISEQGKETYEKIMHDLMPVERSIENAISSAGLVSSDFELLLRNLLNIESPISGVK